MLVDLIAVFGAGECTGMNVAYGNKRGTDGCEGDHRAEPVDVGYALVGGAK
jgi:hypothetical protein